MKKIILLFIICLQMFFSIGIYANNHQNQLEFAIKKDNATFCIDKRIELFYIVAMLADYPRINGFNANYKDDIKNYFSPYLSHEIFSFIKEIGQRWYLDTPTRFMLYFDNNFQLRKDANLPDDLISICGGIDKVRKFQNLLSDFAIKSNYKTFIKDHANFYNTILTTVNYNFSDFMEISRMENYYKQKQSKYTVILNMLGRGNFGPYVKTSRGTEIYAIIQPVTQMGEIPVYLDNRNFNNLLWHEFGHSFINPIVDKYIDDIEKYSKLFEPISSSMTSQAYGNWLSTVREHLTRAVTCRLAANRFGEDVAYLNYERFEIGHRFIYVKPLIDKLKDYEQLHGTYKSFEEFFPELISVFEIVTPEMIDELQKKVEECRNPEVRKIPDAGGFESNNVIIIAPTKEKDSIAQHQLTNYIKNEFMRDKKIRIIDDTLASNEDLSGFDLIVIGTIHGNDFLSKHFNELPIRIYDNKIVAEKEYIGNNLQLVTGWINPYNQDRSMLIYTAQQTEDIIRSNRIPYGSGYTIAEANKVIYYGNFNNPGQIWMCE